jgi:F420-0:gamma-glutamyl ligase
MSNNIAPFPQNKPETISHQGDQYKRYLIRTNRIDADINVSQEIIDSCGGVLQSGDLVCIAESVVAISQKRAYKISEITPGFSARLLSRFVSKTPAGIGLGMAETMQLALREVGYARLYLAALVAAITRTLGRRGDFYRIAGEKARGIDGPTPGTLPPYNEYATLMPASPRAVVESVEQAIADATGIVVQVVLVDANDIGVNIIAPKDTVQEALATAVCADNPMGQGHEQTPVLLARKR